LLTIVQRTVIRLQDNPPLDRASNRWFEFWAMQDVLSPF